MFSFVVIEISDEANLERILRIQVSAACYLVFFTHKKGRTRRPFLLEMQNFIPFQE